jgi:hypothetical protein
MKQNPDESEQFHISLFLVSTGGLAGHSRGGRVWPMEPDQAPLDEPCPQRSSTFDRLLLLIDLLDFSAAGHLAEHWLGWATRALAGTHWGDLSA